MEIAKLHNCKFIVQLPDGRLKKKYSICELTYSIHIHFSVRKRGTNDQDVALTSWKIKDTSETGILEHDIRLRHLYARDCTYV